MDLIPVISWLILRGRCRRCHASVSIRYPAVELLTGLLFMWVYRIYGYPLSYSGFAGFALLLILACILVAVSFIDIDHGIIPFSILAVGAVPALACAVFSVHITLPDALFGAFAGGGIIFACDLFSRLVYKRSGMGGGDMMLMLMTGLFIGLQRTLLSLFFGILLGGVYAVFLLLTGRATKKEVFPFGPFLAVGIWTATLYGEKLIKWYLLLIF